MSLSWELINGFLCRRLSDLKKKTLEEKVKRKE